MSNADLLKIQKEKIKDQDDKLEEFENLLKQTRIAQGEIRNEIDTHIPIIQNMESGMDKVNKKMARTQNKLNQYIESSSNSCLMTVICLNILILLFILLVL
jgi:syntaxin 8